CSAPGTLAAPRRSPWTQAAWRNATENVMMQPRVRTSLASRKGKRLSRRRNLTQPHSRSDPGFGFGPPRYPGTFLLAFRQALAGLHWQARRWLGHAVECVADDGTQRVVGLENLYRRVRGTERTEWSALITSFLQTALGPPGNEEPPTNLDTVA